MTTEFKDGLRFCLPEPIRMAVAHNKRSSQVNERTDMGIIAPLVGANLRDLRPETGQRVSVGGDIEVYNTSI